MPTTPTTRFRPQTRLALAVALAAGTAAVAAPAHAEYPEKPIKLMVGFSAGGGTDTAARGFASYVHESPVMNEMPMVVVNRPGGSGMQAAKVVKDAKPDGYMLYMINSGTFAAADMSNDNAPVQPLDDFRTFGCVTQLVTGLQISADHPAKDAAEWVEQAKASGETVRWSASGAATMHALVGQLMLDTVGIEHQIIPFKGGSNARGALVAGKVDASFNGAQLAAGFEDDIRTIGVPATTRDAANPDVPTFEEQGLPALNVTGPMCLWGHKDIPDDIAAKLEQTVRAVTEIEGFDKFMGKNGLATLHLDAAGGTEATQALYDTLGPVVEKVAAAAAGAPAQ